MTVPYALASFARVCVSKEFTLLALNKTSPIVSWLRELAVHEREAHGGPGVGGPKSTFSEWRLSSWRSQLS